jgi:hypothetical protein
VGNFCNFQKNCPKVNNYPLGENPHNLVTLVTMYRSQSVRARCGQGFPRKVFGKVFRQTAESFPTPAQDGSSCCADQGRGKFERKKGMSLIRLKPSVRSMPRPSDFVEKYFAEKIFLFRSKPSCHQDFIQ